MAFRLASRTQAFQKQIRLTVVVAGTIGGAAFVAVWMYYTSPSSGLDLAIAASAAVPFGLMFGFIFRRLFMTEMIRQHRKIVAEQFGGKPTIPSAIELRSDVLVVRQAGMEMTFPWALCTAVNDNAQDVEINFSVGICVVRHRHFPSTVERQIFLDTARRLAG